MFSSSWRVLPALLSKVAQSIGEHSVQPLQPPQVHLSSQPCVLSSPKRLAHRPRDDALGAAGAAHPGALVIPGLRLVLTKRLAHRRRERALGAAVAAPQVHLSSQPCVLSSQNGLHTGAHSVQPVQPPQVHLSSQACVLSSQNGLHTGDVACTPTVSASDITARTCDVCTSVSVSEEYLDDILDASKIRGGAARSGPTHSR